MKAGSTMTIYDTIGKDYNTTRRPDERILSGLLALLNCPKYSRIADIGAGTGNYSFELASGGYSVCAIDPSWLMMGQGRRHERLQWIQAFAERIPFRPGNIRKTISMRNSDGAFQFSARRRRRKPGE